MCLPPLRTAPSNLRPSRRTPSLPAGSHPHPPDTLARPRDLVENHGMASWRAHQLIKKQIMSPQIFRAQRIWGKCDICFCREIDFSVFMGYVPGIAVWIFPCIYEHRYTVINWNIQVETEFCLGQTPETNYQDP